MENTEKEQLLEASISKLLEEIGLSGTTREIDMTKVLTPINISITNGHVIRQIILTVSQKEDGVSIDVEGRNSHFTEWEKDDDNSFTHMIGETVYDAITESLSNHAIN